MKFLFLMGLSALAAFLGSPDTVWAAASSSSVKSYREWKTNEIQQVQSRLDGVKGRLGGRKKDLNLRKNAGLTEGLDPETYRPSSRIRS